MLCGGKYDIHGTKIKQIPFLKLAVQTLLKQRSKSYNNFQYHMTFRQKVISIYSYIYMYTI